VRIGRFVDLMKPAPTESLYGNGELILVIDDEPNTLLMTRAILEERNYRVVCANAGIEALAMFAAFSEQMSNVRVVLTDIVLPDMKGVALIQDIKKLKKDILFIASIRQGERVPVTELQELGITNFVAKPYDPLKLLKTLRQVLKSQPAQNLRSGRSEGFRDILITEPTHPYINNCGPATSSVTSTPSCAPSPISSSRCRRKKCSANFRRWPAKSARARRDCAQRTEKSTSKDLESDGTGAIAGHAVE
jgi:CheY-like chemotaxis protein